MSEYIYIQNHKLEYLAGFELGLPIWVSRMSLEKHTALDFSTEKFAVFIAELCGITDFHISVTTTRHNAGDDILDDEAGADKLDGGDGIDVADYSNSDAGVEVVLNEGSGVRIGGMLKGIFCFL
ncbi:MAG: hypothetical protein COC24_010265 [Alphaproteobacteria bacterium]|nr:hypothetical protein [Alphaproteobacteria bacterium]